MSTNASEAGNRPTGHRTRTAPSAPGTFRNPAKPRSSRVRLFSLSAAAVTMTIAGLGATLGQHSPTHEFDLTSAQIALDHTAAVDISAVPTVRLEHAAASNESRESPNATSGKPDVEDTKTPAKSHAPAEPESSDAADREESNDDEASTPDSTPVTPPAMSDPGIPPALRAPITPEPDAGDTGTADSPQRDRTNADDLAAGLEQLRTDTLEQATAHARAKAEAKAEAKAKAKAKAEAKAQALREAWVHPIAPDIFRMSAGYGIGGSLWSSGAHTGTDLSGTHGTGIKAVAAGTITDTGWAGAYGNRIELTTTDGHIIWYAHLSEIDIGRGEQVLPGDVIGKLGSTGNSTGPHLHVETFSDGTRTDPVAFFASVGVNLLTGAHTTP